MRVRFDTVICYCGPLFYINRILAIKRKKINICPIVTRGTVTYGNLLEAKSTVRDGVVPRTKSLLCSSGHRNEDDEVNLSA